MSDKSSNIGLIFMILLVIGVFMVALIKTPMSVLFGGNTTDTGTAVVASHIKSDEAVNTGDVLQGDAGSKEVVEKPATEINVVAEVKTELAVPGICVACHSVGVLGAPKIGNKADWEERAKQGIDTLINSAAKGKGNMPPQGAGFSNDQLKEAIEAMLSKAGLGK